MKSRVSPASQSHKNLEKLHRLPVSPIRMSKIEDWDRTLEFSMDQLKYNHIYLMALRYREHPLVQAFYKKRISNAKDDPLFIPDLFTLAIEIDREHYATLLKNRE